MFWASGSSRCMIEVTLSHNQSMQSSESENESALGHVHLSCMDSSMATTDVIVMIDRCMLRERLSTLP